MSTKIYSIPENVTIKTGHEILVEGINEVQARVDKEREDLSTTELVLDNSNKIQFPGFPYVFESLNEKIIVSIDVFKSGYECKVCKGRKRVMTKCQCEAEGHPGALHDDEKIQALRETLGEKIASERAALVCTLCQGDYVSMRHEDACPKCN